jgi:hypothetical protein
MTIRIHTVGLAALIAAFGCTASETGARDGGGGAPGSAGFSGGAGATGAAGTSGAAGATGAAGSSGAAGTNGAAGALGAAGTFGAAGVTGAAGATGGSSGAGSTAGTGGRAGSNPAGAGGTAGPVSDAGVEKPPATDGPSGVPAGYTGTPFGGTPQTIPGKIEIERYDMGGAGVAYNDSGNAHGTTCGFTRPDLLELQCTGQGGPADLNAAGCGPEPAGSVYLGYIGTGNWYRYSVDITQAGTYVISGHEGIAGGGVKVQFTFTSTMKTGPVTLPSTDVCGHEAYHVWALQNNLATIDLVPGKYVLQIDIVSAAMNLDWFAFTKM